MRLGPRGPAEQIDQQRRNETIMFGGGEQQPVIAADHRLDRLHALGNALQKLQIGIEQRGIEIGKVDQCRPRPDRCAVADDESSRLRQLFGKGVGAG